MEITTDKLNSIELFAGLTEKQTKTIVAVGKLKVYQQGKVILEKGEKSTEVYVVLKGQVEVISDLTENTTSLVILGAGQSFGEMALLDAGPRSASIRCLSAEAKILVFDRGALLNFWKEKCKVGYKMISNIARDLAFKLRIRNITCDICKEEEAL